MECSKCGATMEDGHAFCTECGAKAVPKEEAEIQMAVATGAYDSYSGKRRGSENVGKTIVHYGKAEFKEEVVKDLNVFLVSNGYNPKVTQNGKDTIIKVEKTNIVKYLVGLNKSATVTITASGKNLVVSVGEPQWIDKVIGLVLGWFTFGIIWLIVAFGIYEQYDLFKKITNETGLSLMSKS